MHNKYLLYERPIKYDGYNAGNRGVMDFMTICVLFVKIDKNNYLYKDIINFLTIYNP
jgi:hypothetical protein